VSSIAIFALARFIELRVRVPGMVGSSQ
jgi:hypothetical protein